MSEQELVPPENAGVELAQEMIQDQKIEIAQEAAQDDLPKEDHVPLSKFIKERKKRQEAEQRAMQAEKQRQQVDDTAQYESATRADLGHTQNEIIRIVEERQWARNNPEKYERLQANLEDFLEKKPYLAEALKHAPNRWEEAYELMDALSTKERKVAKPVEKRRDAPNSPTSVPKASAINEVKDFMAMTDAEYRAYRESKRVRR
jgi:hypothetical protein